MVLSTVVLKAEESSRCHIDFFKLVYLFLVVLPLPRCILASSCCSEQESLFFVVHGLLTVVASLVAEHRL